MIDALFRCWLITYEALAQPSRMRKRYAQALYLSPGFSDYHVDIACMEVGYESDGRVSCVSGVDDRRLT